MTVAEMLSRISSYELTEWKEFFKLEPFGFEADYLGHAWTQATLLNINKKKSKKAVNGNDLMPKFKDTDSDSLDGAINFVATLTELHGGKDLRHGDNS